MTNEQNDMLVLRDEAGSYFLLPPETLEQGRVPVEHAAEVERLVVADSPKGDDVQGHLVVIAVIGVLMGMLLPAIQ